MVDSDGITTAYPVLATLVVGFAVVYVGFSVLQQWFPERQDI